MDKKYTFKINGKQYEVTVGNIEGKNASVTVNGVEYNVEMENPVAAAPVAAPVNTPAVAPASAPAAPAAPVAPTSAGAGSDVTAPLPGVIISVNVAVGDKVQAGMKVAVLEAMKMENDIEAEVSGTVTAIHVSKGDSVLEGAKIVTIA
ncbi:MAG: acetyl-CoA carboxylase biotin carboxyl carrier protein subunit [Bacteroidales bacterium]|nr:acetyl-CoA carboxylase biotin carboxyl carrier protein subunit [Bacteroidales bacterium]